MRPRLKIGIIQTYGSQVIAARALGIGETRLSRIVRGHVEPRQVEREKLISVFGVNALRRSHGRRFDEAADELAK